MKNKKIVPIIVTAMVLSVGLLSNYMIQPYLNNTKWDFFPLSYLLVIPYTYYLATFFGFPYHASCIRRLIIVTLIMATATIILNINDMERVMGNTLAFLCGTALTMLPIFYKKYERKD